MLKARLWAGCWASLSRLCSYLERLEQMIPEVASNLAFHNSFLDSS